MLLCSFYTSYKIVRKRFELTSNCHCHTELATSQLELWNCTYWHTSRGRLPSIFAYIFAQNAGAKDDGVFGMVWSIENIYPAISV